MSNYMYIIEMGEKSKLHIIELSYLWLCTFRYFRKLNTTKKQFFYKQQKRSAGKELVWDDEAFSEPENRVNFAPNSLPKFQQVNLFQFQFLAQSLKKKFSPSCRVWKKNETDKESFLDRVLFVSLASAKSVLERRIEINNRNRRSYVR
jgi:hypothetical protein